MVTKIALAASATNHQRQHVDWRAIAWFIAGAFALSWAAALGQRTLGIPLELPLNMFGPAVACILVRLFRREGFADAGLRLAAPGVQGVWRVYLAAYLIPLGALLVGLASSLIIGLQQWTLPSTFEQLHLPLALIPVGVLADVTIVPVAVMILTLGEELGWRGYLLPRLLPLGGVRAALIVGLIWGIWHAPLIVLNKAVYGGLYPWLGVPAFMVVIMAFSIYYTWLRVRAGSIWPAVLTHAVNNAFASFIFVGFTPGNPYLGAPVGILSVLPFVAVDLWLVLSGRLNLTVLPLSIVDNS